MFLFGPSRSNFLKQTRVLQNQKPKLITKTFKSKQQFNMPLVVPGINSGDGASKTQEWMGKLAGKKLGDSHDATVGTFLLSHNNSG